MPPFSVRPLSGAPVAMPLAWSDVSPRLNPRDFHLRNVPRLTAGGTPWDDFFAPAHRRSLPALGRAWEEAYGASPRPPMSRFRGPYR